MPRNPSAPVEPVLTEPVPTLDVFISGPPIVEEIERGVFRVTLFSDRMSLLDGRMERPAQASFVATTTTLRVMAVMLGQAAKTKVSVID